MSIQNAVDNASKSISRVAQSPSAGDLMNTGAQAVQGLYDKALDDVLKETKLPYRKVITAQIKQRIEEQRKVIKGQKDNVLNKIKMKKAGAE